MVFDSLAGHRMIGMVQPVQPGGYAGDGLPVEDGRPKVHKIGCAGRIVQYAEIGDGRCFLTLMGVARFHVAGEIPSEKPYRTIRADFSCFFDDFHEGAGENDVDRRSLVDTLRDFATANELKIDWDDVEQASNEALVNALSMMSPYGAREKQALLEAPTLEERISTLVALLEMSGGNAGPVTLN